MRIRLYLPGTKKNSMGWNGIPIRFIRDLAPADLKIGPEFWKEQAFTKEAADEVRDDLVEDVKGRGGSHYVIPRVKAIFE